MLGALAGVFALNYQRLMIVEKLDKVVWAAGKRTGLPAAAQSAPLWLFCLPHVHSTIWFQVKVLVADHQTENKSNIFFLRYTGCVPGLAGNHDNSMVVILNDVFVHSTKAFTVT